MKFWNAKQAASVSTPNSSTAWFERIPPQTFRTSLAWSVVLSALIYLPSLTWTFGHDQNVFAEIGSLILKGKLPYIDAWDIKPPNIYYVYALAEWIFGRHEFAIRIFDYLSMLATSILLFLFVIRVGRRDKQTYELAILAPVLLAWIALSLGLADTAQTESFSLPFIAGAMLAWQYNERARYALLTGLLLGIAAFFKTTNILLALPFLLDAAIIKHDTNWKKTSALLILGIFLACSFELLFMLWQGFFSEYLNIAISVFNLHSTEKTGFPGTFWAPLRIPLLYAGSFAFSSVIGLCILLFAKTSDKTGRSKILQAIAFTFSLLLVAILAVVLQRKGWGYHYVILLPGLIPFLTICTGEFFRTITFWVRNSNEIVGRSLIVLVTLLMLIVQPMNRRRVVSFEQSTDALMHRSQYLASMGEVRGMYYPLYTVALAEYLRKHTSETDRVFILGQEPGGYWQADRIPATRYIYTLLFTSPMMTDERFAELNQTLLQHPPKLIVVEQFDTLAFSGVRMTSQMLLQTLHLRDLHNLLDTGYVLRDTVSENFLIYQRKS